MLVLFIMWPATIFFIDLALSSKCLLTTDLNDIRRKYCSGCICTGQISVVKAYMKLETFGEFPCGLSHNFFRNASKLCGSSLCVGLAFLFIVIMFIGSMS